MIEYGSDFHWIADSYISKGGNLPCDGQLYACGRHAITSLLHEGQRCMNWERIWMPEYFCYEVIGAIARTGIEIRYYPDSPEKCDDAAISALKFQEGDVLFRMNYFGLRGFRSNKNIPVPVIEDHSHNLLSEWALNSDADYCTASLRKTLPLTAGGILWSPRGCHLPEAPASNAETENLSKRRADAMRQKTLYLNGQIRDKSNFRNCYMETEETLGTLPVSSISRIDRALLTEFDTDRFYRQKYRNYAALKSLLHKNINILVAESPEAIPFSMILKFDSRNELEHIKRNLVNSSVYAAHLWPLPKNIEPEYGSYLSIHCDGRYSEDDMEELARRINKSYKE